MLFSSLFIFVKLFILLPQPSTSTLTLLNFPFFSTDSAVYLYTFTHHRISLFTIFASSPFA